MAEKASVDMSTASRRYCIPASLSFIPLRCLIHRFAVFFLPLRCLFFLPLRCLFLPLRCLFLPLRCLFSAASLSFQQLPFVGFFRAKSPSLYSRGLNGSLPASPKSRFQLARRCFPFVFTLRAHLLGSIAPPLAYASTRSLSRVSRSLRSGLLLLACALARQSLQLPLRDALCKASHFACASFGPPLTLVMLLEHCGKITLPLALLCA